MKKPKGPLTGRKLADTIAAAALAKKAERIIILNVEHVSSLCDWMVICQGNNPFQTRAIADSIITVCSTRNTVPYLCEGLEGGRWIVVDFSDVLVHVFLPQLRAYYAIEDLWPSAARFPVLEETGHV